MGRKLVGIEVRKKRKVLRTGYDGSDLTILGKYEFSFNSPIRAFSKNHGFSMTQIVFIKTYLSLYDKGVGS